MWMEKLKQVKEMKLAVWKRYIRIRGGKHSHLQSLLGFMCPALLIG
jgi:hypothetical protein